ncbi:hypothetical protein P4283_05790 [Bacillus thuringiensis]|nr:hypothetical protein [Bacillus thuringiensis]
MKALKDQLREWKKHLKQQKKNKLSTRDIEGLMVIRGPLRQK